nr:MAG TPA: hypothetical protein [Bacteriophage sp.]
MRKLIPCYRKALKRMILYRLLMPFARQNIPPL